VVRSQKGYDRHGIDNKDGTDTHLPIPTATDSRWRPGAPRPAAAECGGMQRPADHISFSYAASDVSGMKVGGSVGFGLWSVGGSHAHDESHRSMQSDMEKLGTRSS